MNATSTTAARRRDPAQVSIQVEDWLRGKAGYAQARITQFERPSGAGLSNETYLFNCQSAQGDERLVLQVGPAGQGLFQHYDLGSMARIQQELARVSEVPVPEVRWYEGSPALLGSPFFVMQRVPGQVPGDNPTYHQGGFFAALPQASRKAVWCSGITALVQLHQVDIRNDRFAFLESTPWGMPRQADAVATRLGQWRAFMRWGSPAPLAIIEDALLQLENTRPAAQPLRIAWGDAKLSNCVVAGTEVQALLDWELCGLSDPAEDLAFWLLLDWAHYRIPGVERLDGLPSAQDTVAFYIAQAGQPIHAVLWWFKFGLVRLALIYHRFIERRLAQGRLPPGIDAVAANPVCALLPEGMALEKLP